MKTALEQTRLLVPPSCRPTPALFLDRDGVVIEDCHHIDDPSLVRLCRGSRKLIASAKSYGWPVVIVTNQSGISRGLFQWKDFDTVNDRMQQLLGSDAPLAAIYANGYGPDAPAHSWRKPNPQMILEASKALNLDLQRSFLIGDRLSDLHAGASAGLFRLFHVLTGHGCRSRESVIAWHRMASQASACVEQSSPRLPALELLNTLEDFELALLKHANPA